MQILEKEIGLREETRGLEQARAQLESEVYGARTEPLADTQAGLQDRVAEVIKKLRELPDGPAKFGKVVGLLSQVKPVMGEARDLLARPETGSETIAAETEVIELLLQAKRVNPKGGGGGGGATPGGGSTGTTDESALALLGSGEEKNAEVVARSIGQATGTAGSQLPAEFRRGLDAYFSALEGTGNRKPSSDTP